MKKTTLNPVSEKTPQRATNSSKLGKIKASSILRKEAISNLKGGGDGSNIIITDKDVF